MLHVVKLSRATIACQHQVPTQGNVQIHSKAIAASGMNVLCGGNHDPKFPMDMYRKVTM